MLSQLQKQFQQVSSKIFSPPTTKAAVAKPVMKSSATVSASRVGPAIPVAPSLKKKKEDPNLNEAEPATASSASPSSLSDEATAASNSSSSSTLTKEEQVAAARKPRTKVQSARMRSIQSAMSKERAVREAQEPFDFWTNVRQFNWKALIIFMICWTILGYYVVPAIKGWKGFTPPTPEEKNKEYNEGKQKLVGDTYRLRQRIEARKLRAERLETLEVSQQGPSSSDDGK